jgi:hypothetical protein
VTRTARRLASAILIGLLGWAVAPSAHAQEPAAGVVLVGIAGLAWQDVTAEDAPTLHSLVGPNAVASLTVRTVRARTCVVDGWLTVGAGRRASDVQDLEADDQPDRYCRDVPEPTVLADGDVAVPGWDELVLAQQEQTFDTRLGLLGDRVAEARSCTTAVGPGAVLALARSDGVARNYAPDPTDVDEALLTTCPVTVIDLGSVPPPGEPGDEEAEAAAAEARRAAVSNVDAALAQLLAYVPADVAVLVAGIADSAPTEPPEDEEPSTIARSALRVALAAGPQPNGVEYGPNWLSSPSTRWTGLVQLTDLASTLAAYAGVTDPSEGTVGRPWRSVEEHPSSTNETIDQLVGTDRATQVFRTQSGPFFQILGVAEVLFFVAAVLWLRGHPTGRQRLIRLVQYAALGAASFPVASFLANLSRWWRFERTGTLLWTTVLVITVVVTVLALRGPWRHRIYGPPGAVAALTATVLAVDVSTGSNLQHASLLGLSPLVAGRFYGFGNIPYAIFVASALVAAAALGQLLLDYGHSRRTAALAVAAVGVITVVVDGAPQAGADVGGILATVPGFAVLVMGIAGVRVTAWRMALVGAIAVAVCALIAWLDWLRPATERTHFGEFFADLVDGDAWPVVWRKAQASIGTLQRSPYYGWLVPVAYGVIIWLVRSPGVGGVQAAVTRWAVLRPLIWAGLVTGAVGFAVNDSGIIVPGLLLTVGIPLVVSAIADAQLQEGRTEQPPATEAPERRPATADPGVPGSASPPR